MPFATSIKLAFRQYAVFSGRATRAEFWWWILFLTIGNIGLGLTEGVIQLAIGTEFTALTLLFALTTVLPSLAVTCRRLHDIGKTGWWQAVWHIFPTTAWLFTAAAFVVASTLAAIRAADPDQTISTAQSYLPFFMALIGSTTASLGVLVWAIVWMTPANREQTATVLIRCPPPRCRFPRAGTRHLCYNWHIPNLRSTHHARIRTTQARTEAPRTGQTPPSGAIQPQHALANRPP